MNYPERSVFVTGLKSASTVLPGHYWNGISDPTDLDLDKGGLAFFDIRENPKNVMFDVLISSGPRDPAADPLADSTPYWGPSAIYTCFVVTVEFGGRAETRFGYDDTECEPKLVTTLGDQAKFYPVDAFSG